MYCEVYILWGNIHLMLGIRTLWAGVVHERPAGDHSDWKASLLLRDSEKHSVTSECQGVYRVGYTSCLLVT